LFILDLWLQYILLNFLWLIICAIIPGTCFILILYGGSDRILIFTSSKCLSGGIQVEVQPPGQSRHYNINCPQHLGHTDGSRSGVKMFLRVVILVFAATCCRARVIGKSLHTSKLVHSVGNRTATEADVKQAVTSWLQTLHTYLFCTLIL
jgi:hypothetical protein